MPPSPRRIDPHITQSNKIFIENTKILPRLISPKLKFPLNPNAGKYIKQYNDSRKYAELSQKFKQPWKIKLRNQFLRKISVPNGSKMNILLNEKAWKNISKLQNKNNKNTTKIKNDIE